MTKIPEIKTIEPEERPLPQLRKDLTIYRGPDELDGTPTFSIYDPVRAQYFKIKWAEATLIRFLRPGININQLREAVNGNTTLKLTNDDIKSFFQEAANGGLLETKRSSEFLTEQVKKGKVNPLFWALYHYLYIRIPLFNPDQFLTRTVGYVKYLFSKPAMLLYLFLSLVGITHLMFNFGEYIHTFPYFFNAQGFLIYALMIISIKVFHEFAHAYVAKYYGVKVPAMGILFMVLWPVMFTDVTDAWKLSSRKQRLWISGAGVISELILAGLCTLGWALSEPGMAQSVFFIISSATWISTIIVNINPALRFDGYYLATDLLGIDNLQSRSFAITRWQLRRTLLGIKVPPPEEGLTNRQHFGMVIYSIYTWIYRIFLYTAIAVIVYFRFTKALGIFLFIMEIILFMGMPIYSEIKQLKLLRKSMSFNRRSTTSLVVLSLFVVWFVMPLPRTERFPAITTPAENQVLWVPHQARIDELFVSRGDTVRAGQPLVSLVSEDLKASIVLTQLEAQEIKRQMDVFMQDANSRALLPEKQSSLSALEEQLEGLKRIQQQLTIKAEVDGEIYQWDEHLSVGQSVGKDQVLGQVAPLGSMEIECYVPESLVGAFELGNTVLFRSNGNLQEVEGVVTTIRQSRARFLRYPQLASVYGGEIPVLPTEGKALSIVESYYPVRIEIKNPPENMRFGETGEVFVTGYWRSRFISIMRYVLSILWRESGF